LELILVTWLVEKNITLASATTAYLRALYHIYNQFASGGSWYQYGQIYAVSDSAHFASEAAVQSGDWFVVQLTNRVNNEKFQIFFGGITGSGSLGPYTASAAGLYITSGFTGNWTDASGFIKDSGLLLLSDDSGGEVWKFHLAISTDLSILCMFGATDGVSTPNDFDIGFQAGQYAKVDSDDHFETFILVGNPNTEWDNASDVHGKSFSEFEDQIIDCCLRSLVTDATMLGKDSSYFIKSLDLCVVDNSSLIGMFGRIYGIYQCRDSGVADGTAIVDGGHTYTKSNQFAFIFD
jgi:hypothetical protein